MHLLGVGKIIDVNRMEVWMIGVEQRLEDPMAGGRIDFVDGFCRHRFSHDVGDKLQQPMAESWVLFGLLSHLFRGRGAFDPNLCTQMSAKGIK